MGVVSLVYELLYKNEVKASLESALFEPNEEEKADDAVQEFEENAIDVEDQFKIEGDDFVAVDSNQTNVEQFDELVLITNTCHIAVPVTHQPSDDVPTLIKIEI